MGSSRGGGRGVLLGQVANHLPHHRAVVRLLLAVGPLNLLGRPRLLAGDPVVLQPPIVSKLQI